MQRNETFDPANKELEIAFAGDRDFGAHEARRIFPIQDAKIARLTNALMRDGFIASGMQALPISITNLLPQSNAFSGPEWVANGLASVTDAFAPNRHGQAGKAARLQGNGPASYISATLPGLAMGRLVFSVDMRNDAGSGQVKLEIHDGDGLVASASETLGGAYEMVQVSVDATWAAPGSDLELRIYPATGAAGSVVIADAQVEAIAAGDPLEAGRRIPTDGAPATGPGHRVLVLAGQAVVKGLPRPFAQQVLSFDPLVTTGAETIWAEMAERYLSGLVTPELENPTTGNDGNDSVREETTLVLSDTTNAAIPEDPDINAVQYRSRFAVPVFQFDRATSQVGRVVETTEMDIARTVGTLPGDRLAPQSIPEDRLALSATEGQPGLRAALGRRLNNQSGDFVRATNGLLPSITQNLDVTTAIAMLVSPLDGYVNGKAQYLDVPGLLETPLQDTTGLRENESQTYYNGTDTYTLTKAPVQAVDRLVGYYRVTRTIVRGATPGGADPLPDVPVFLVETITQGPTTFNGDPGGDYTQTGDQISWAGPGAEPAVGTSYQVTYLYTREVPASEFTFDDTSITFTAAPPNRPADTYPILVDYTYGQDRVDLVILTEQGLAVLLGTPSDQPAPPPVPKGALALWEVPVAFGATQVATFRPRFTLSIQMADLVDIQTTLSRLLYDVAALSANVDMTNRLGNLSSSVTDPFLDGSLFDTTAALFGPPTNANQARIDGGRLKLARATQEVLLVADPVQPGVPMARQGDWAGLPFTAVDGISQPQFSNTISVNPYANVDPIPPIISVSGQLFAVGGSNPLVSPFSITLVVSGRLFFPGETVQLLRDTTPVGTAIANARGEISATLNLSGVTGSTLLRAVGVGGTASATLASGIAITRIDPAAQSFAFPGARDIVGYAVRFAAKDATKGALARLQPMVAGVPDTKALPGTEREFKPADVTIGAESVVTLARPYMADPEEALAIVVGSEASTWFLQSAKLGQLNQGPGGGLITRNPYGGGVLLSSSDGRSWTPIQDQDLAFRVLVAQYVPNQQATLTLAPATFATPIGAFALRAEQVVRLGASVRWEFSTDPTGPNPGWTAFDPGNPNSPREVELAEVTSTLGIRAIARTTDQWAGVAINLASLALRGFTQATDSSYVQRTTTLPAPTDTLKAFIRSFAPAGTSVTPQASVNNGANWVLGTQDGVRPLPDGSVETEWSFTFGAPGSAFRGRLDLTGTPTKGPEVEQVAFAALP